ncbi:hypothetical protein PDIDSM_7396 [Penicillium digitatum]|nr:hypothetical protein PDIDSM_7396 [Penicillium digitatum]
MESGERLGIRVAHSVEAPGEGKQWETRTKEARVTVVCLRDAGVPSEYGERPILRPVDSDGVAVSVSDGLKKRPEGNS